MVASLWWVLFLPFVAFLLNVFLPKRFDRVTGWIATAGIFISFLLVLKLSWPLFQNGHLDGFETKINWINTQNLQLEFGLLWNALSAIMLLVVTGIGSAIFYYSIEYMEHDESFRRYFTSLSLFAFSMIGIVLSSNLLQLFIFWELVGVSSYLLIGHWYQKPEAADAGKKAFLTNRVGDFGFLLGILWLWMLSGTAGVRTLNFLELGVIAPVLEDPALKTQLGFAMLLIFTGVMGKSAQFPLHVWLPDAMEGPTPVSALIHAATMVAAGVFLLTRTFFLFSISEMALHTIAYIGGFTAIFAATQAIVQKDIKRILAYSTLSQLGYMVMAVGLGNSGIAMFHLTTHAFFKALLFLAAGSIIHATHEQDITKMGGLLKNLPITSAVFLIGTFALCGFWPSSGFWSKEGILALALHENMVLFSIAAFTAFLTALYMGRLVVLTFFGKSHLHKKPHEPGPKMLIPLIILAVFSLVSGALSVPHLLNGGESHEAHAPQILAIASNALAAIAILIAFLFYGASERLRQNFGNAVSGIREVLIQKYYMDAFYDFILQYVQKPIAEFCQWFEKYIVVEGAVNGSARLSAESGKLLRRLQNGNVQAYLSYFLTGVMALVYFLWKS